MAQRNTLLTIAFGLSIVLATSDSAFASSLPCPADAKLATLLAASDTVLIGKMDVPEKRLREEALKPLPEYLDIPIDVESIVKGASPTSEPVRFYPKDAPYQPSDSTMLDFAGKPAILFLTRANSDPVRFYFAGYTPDALKLADDRTVSAIHAEVARQEKILASWRTNDKLPHFAEVGALIARLGQVSDDRQQRVFDQLEALGETAVPAIIAQMDDRRPLRTQAISLKNHALDAFEGKRHYGPNQVVDGLAAVLNQITGLSFGSIANGGTKDQRDAAIRGWRVFAADLDCKKRFSIAPTGSSRLSLLGS